MLIGIPKEIKTAEYRVALLPDQVGQLVEMGHQVCVEHGAGRGAGFPDRLYSSRGAQMVDGAKLWTADLIVKVKEPQSAEYSKMRPRQKLFAYLHLAADRELTLALLDRGVHAFAFETYRDEGGRLPLLAPMSAIAGRMAVFYGAQALQAPHGGPGVLLAGLMGESPRVAVVGAGVAGTESARAALGLGAQVVAIDRMPAALERLQQSLPGVQTELLSDRLLDQVGDADLIIGAVLLPGASAPRLLGLDEIRALKPGAVLVDIAIDQGGCFQGSVATTHLQPFIQVESHTLCAVANLPGAVPQSASRALSAAIFPILLQIIRDADSPELRSALATKEGNLYCAGTASAHNLKLTS